MSFRCGSAAIFPHRQTARKLRQTVTGDKRILNDKFDVFQTLKSGEKAIVTFDS